MDKKSYFAIVLGGGPGGIRAARELARAKKKVALISDEIGGECMNYGCIPSKAYLFAGELLEKTKKAEIFGLSGTALKPNMKALIARKKSVVRTLGVGVKSLLKLEGVELFEGRGKIISDHTIECNDTIIEAENLILAMGSGAVNLPGIIKSKNIMDNWGVFELTEIPRSIGIVGGGAVGVEFASFFRTMGSEVTIFEYGPALIRSEDVSIYTELRKIFERQGITVITEAAVTEAVDDGKNVTIKWKSASEIQQETFSKTLIAVGRIPACTKEEADILKIKLGKRGIETNDFMQTENPRVYAIGDIAGKSLLAYSAEREGEIAAERMLGQNPKPLDYNTIPNAIFCHPEIASVGMNKNELEKQHIPFAEATARYTANSRAIIEDELDGFLKIYFDKTHNGDKNPKIRGAHMIGAKASEIITPLTLAVSMNLGLADLQKILIPHPVSGELIKEAVEKAARVV